MASNTAVPQSEPLVFKELQGVKSYAELIEVLNFNFSRIANSPFFRGKQGNPGDKGNPGWDGPRGNRIFYVDVDALNAALGSIYNLDTNKFTLDALNEVYLTRNAELKQALKTDSFVQHDWLLLPDGLLTILWDDVAAEEPTSRWVETSLQFLTSTDTQLIEQIKNIIDAQLANYTFGSFKTYDAAFNIVKDDPSTPNAGIANVAAGPKQGGVLPILKEKQDAGNAYSSNPDVTVVALSDEQARANSASVLVIGNYLDWYNVMQNTLPVYNGVADENRNAAFTPNIDSVPGAVVNQRNYNNGLMFGNPAGTVHDYGMLFKSADGLHIRPRFSWDRATDKPYDPRIVEQYLPNSPEGTAYTAAYGYVLRMLTKYIAGAESTEDFIEAIKFAFQLDSTDPEDQTLYPTAVLHDSLRLVMPDKLSNGLLFAKNKRLTIANVAAARAKLLVTDANDAIKPAVGKPNSFAGYDVNGAYIETEWPLPSDYIDLEDSTGQPLFTPFKHIHDLMWTRGSNQTLIDIANGAGQVTSAVQLPNPRPILPDKCDVLAKVILPVLTVGNSSTNACLAVVKCVMSYQIATIGVNIPIDPEGLGGVVNLSYVGINSNTPGSYAQFMQRASVFEFTFMLKDCQTRVAYNETSSIASTIVFNVNASIAGKSGEPIQQCLVGSPIVTLIPLVTGVATDRSKVADPEETGVGAWIITDPNAPTEEDFVVS